MRAGRSRRGFTLVEVLAVVSIMALTAGLVMTRLDRVTDRGRLRAAATQLESVLHLAQTQARTSGLPRRMRYATGASRIALQQPVQRDGRWVWGEAVEWDTATGVKIEALRVEGRGETSSLRIDTRGRYAAHAVVLSLHESYAIILAQPWTQGTVKFAADFDPTADYELLRAQVEAGRGEN